MFPLVHCFPLGHCFLLVPCFPSRTLPGVDIPDRAGRARRPRPPWRVRAAVLLIAGWWAGSFVYLIGHSAGDSVKGESLGAYLGLGLWTLVVILLLRNTWRGGGATQLVAGAALFFGVCYEVTGALLTLLWLLDVLSPSLVDGGFVMVIAACPLAAWRLLRHPTARAYARPRHASVVGPGEDARADPS